ncbi:MAG: response regulator [Clostridia bacterium]|nr:response regulator [Clostridia bacterium]
MSERIMICDSSADVRAKARKILIKNGFEVAAEANNVRYGLEFYKELTPDIAIIDVSLPDTDGVDLMEKILGENPQMNIIMMSAMGHKAFVESLIDSGAKAVIVKPVSEKKLLEAINKI